MKHITIIIITGIGVTIYAMLDMYSYILILIYMFLEAFYIIKLLCHITRQYCSIPKCGWENRIPLK